jgi:hypothetical protein
MKFIYVADTHVGGSDISGYWQQERYLRYFPELFEVFSRWIEQQGNIDFVIHGGDMVDKASPEAITDVAEMFQKLPCPLYFTPGNHDLTEDDSAKSWLEKASDFFNNDGIDFSFCHDNVKFDFISCHWGQKPYFWNPVEAQIPYWETAQTQLLGNEGSFKHKVIVTHAPVFGLPCTQTGMNEELHPPAGDFSDFIHKLAVKHKVLLVLGAHTHMNMHLCKDGVHYVTVSAFSEVPFEFKVFEISDDDFSMKTIGLADQVNFNFKYNFDKTYIQGRACDRSFEEKLT